MNTTPTTPHRQSLSTAIAAGLVAALAVVLVPIAAHASRLPSDPFAFAPTPLVQARLVADAHAANVWAELQDLAR
jgi:hypothetical protein